jgi:hypothetical protein
MERKDPGIPATDDLAGWKEADSRLIRRFVNQMREDWFRSARALEGYFGDEDAQSLLVAHESRAVVQAYTTWAILDYRPTRKGKTHAETMLAEGLPEPELTLLRARIESHPSLYRIASHNAKAGAVVLEDVLLGGAVTVYDRLFSENIDDGIFIAARVYPAGRFHFFDMVGPPLGEMMGEEAAEFLHDCGLDFTKEGLRRDAHLFGRLWGWMDRWEANWRPPRLCNTDGDELLWHTASFSVADPAKVRQALLHRKDINHDEQEDEFVWSKATGKGSKMLGGSVTLGRITFIGDELLLTANSAKRFTTGRKWLEKLPGVVFGNVVTRPLDEPAKDRPLDERISKPEPVEMTPELTAAVQEMMNKQYMGWLDTPLPVLKGKTPRQACQTPDGRRQVTMLIRTTPDPMGPAPVRVPRQAMLRELGLDTEPPQEPVSGPQELPLPELPAAGFPDGKVGRNDPCPCSSGKKYKKCCGR